MEQLAACQLCAQRAATTWSIMYAAYVCWQCEDKPK